MRSGAEARESRQGGVDCGDVVSKAMWCERILPKKVWNGQGAECSQPQIRIAKIGLENGRGKLEMGEEGTGKTGSCKTPRTSLPYCDFTCSNSDFRFSLCSRRGRILFELLHVALLDLLHERFALEKVAVEIIGKLAGNGGELVARDFRERNRAA